MVGHRRIKVTEDNGKVYETDLYLPNIRNVVGFLEGVWDFTIYDNCFEGKNKLGDVDGSIELHGHTMVLEFKRTRYDLTGGQVIKAVRQAKHSNITTFFIFGETNRPVEYLRFSPNNLQGTGFVKCNVMELSKQFKAWNDYAARNSLVSKNDIDWTIAKRYLNSVGGGKGK